MPFVRLTDDVIYRLERDRIILTKASACPRDDAFAAFHQWKSEAVGGRYADLKARASSATALSG